jgi:DNA-binding transcriptional regulator YiaG
MTIHDILTTYGYTQTSLARRFGIPLRTVQNWCGGARTPPEYVIGMMVEILGDPPKKG